MANPSEQISAIVRRVTADIGDKMAISAVLQQISAGLADVVALLEAQQQPEKPGTAGDKSVEHEAEARIKAQALADVLGPLLAGLKLPEPQVQVSVQPATVPEPKVSVNVQPAPVTIAHDKSGQAWDVEFKRPPNNPSGPMTGLRITRL